MRAVRDQVGLLCDQLSRWPALEQTIRDGGAEPALSELRAVLGGDTDPDPARITDLVEAVEQACARQGLAGLASRDYAIPSLPPGVAGSAAVTAWVCPLGRCDRVVLPDEAATPPGCAVTGGTPMAPFQLPPS